MSRNVPSPLDKISIDSGVITAYFLGEALGKKAKSEIFVPEKNLFCNRLAVSELFYILCRRRGVSFARRSTEIFLKTRLATVIGTDELDLQAGAYKCGRTLSLADCYVLGLAKLQGATALFARREQDLDEEIRRKPFDVEIAFLEDLV